MKKEFEIYQDNKGNVYTITTELEELLLEDLVKLHSIINEIEAIIYNNQITGIEARLEIQERLDKLQEY